MAVVAGTYALAWLARRVLRPSNPSEWIKLDVGHLPTLWSAHLEEHESCRLYRSREIRLGRGPSNDLVIEDPFVSLSHARIYLEKEQFWLEDLGSTNRTYVNGELVNGPQRLEQVAIITLGNAVVVFHTSPNSPVGKG